MEVRVSGHQIDTGTSLQDNATDRLTAIVEKYFSRALSAHVTFGKAPGGAFSCDIVAHIKQISACTFSSSAIASVALRKHLRSKA